MQELKEELSRSKEERSSLQEQCNHLEARRRHADRYEHTHTGNTYRFLTNGEAPENLCVCVRCLSAVEVELAKQRKEHSHTQVLKQEALRDTTATQEQLNGMTSSLILFRVSHRVKHTKALLHYYIQSVTHRLERIHDYSYLDARRGCTVVLITLLHPPTMGFASLGPQWTLECSRRKEL